MTPLLNKICRETLLCLPLMFLLSFFCTSFCSATVNKSTATVLVSTTKQNNWYDESDPSLHTFAVCDGGGGSGSTYNKFVPCNTDGVHDDFYSTDTNDERDTYPASENFTIKASASASSGSMSKIKFEWIAGVTGTPSDTSWTDKNKEPGSYTCSGTGTCTICVVGGTCTHPVIPQAALGVYPEDGAQRRLFFRVTYSSSTGDNITTGWDSTLDKFYRFVICGPACSAHTCGQYTPSVTTDYVNSPANFCDGLNDTNGYYTIGWKDDKMPSNTVQTYYKVSVRKKDTVAPVNSSEASSSATSFKIPSSWLNYDTTYEWQVATRFKGQGCEWIVTSPWSSGATDIKVPHRFPVAKMSVTNGLGADCLAGGCYWDESISFNADGSTISVGSPAYAWTVDGNNYSGVAVSKVLTGPKHTAKLKVTDGDGHFCSINSGFDLAQNAAKSCEVEPSVSLGNLYKPKDLCNGLNGTDGYYAISWQSAGLPAGAKQSNYEVRVRSKKDPAKVFTNSIDSSGTMFSIPVTWLAYDNTYEWQVKVTIVSVDKKCSWDLTTPWSSGDKNIIVPHPYPVSAFTVNNPGKEDCFTEKCRTGEMIAFDGSSSTSSTGSRTYDWILDGTDYTGEAFVKSFPDTDHAVSLKVTDGDGHSCVSAVKKFYLMNPSCPPAPKTSLSDWDANDYCTKLDYTLKWENSDMPAGSKQVSYEVTVRNKKDPTQTHSMSVDSSVRIFSIPSSWLSYGEVYEWQVKTGIVTADSKCSWGVFSPWSSGDMDITIPKQFPTSSVSVLNGKGISCLDESCPTGEDVDFGCDCSSSDSITFDASDPAIVSGDFTYAWIVDGKSYSGLSFVESFKDADHVFSLKVVEKSSGLTCSTPDYKFCLGKSQAIWNEIAPR